MSKQIDMDIENVPQIIAACCVLHNVCEIHGDSFNDEWLQEVDSDQPDDNELATSVSVSSTSRSDLRTILMEYFKHN